MSKLGVVEDTLFVPMLGRIYASEHCPQIIYDKKALELKEKLSPDLLGNGSQSQYTLLASAARSANMDRFIQEFLMRKPDGVIVQLGCGLETTYYRCDNGKTRWYAVDLPHVIDYRRELLPERNGKPILPEMPFPRTGSGRFARICPTPLSLLPQAGCFTILRKIRLFPCFVCSDNSEI